jgi:hypothetical protein
MSIAILVWHMILGLGSLLGFASALFLVYDRLIRYRPIASLNAVLGFGDTSPSHASPTLHVKNTAPFHILVERFTVSPPYWSVAPSVELDGMTDVISGADTPILLAPFEDRDLLLVMRDQSGARSDQRIDITIHWRRGSARRLRQWPIRMRTSLDDIELRKIAALNA